ncbi:hypothetical protein HK104_006077, partial [Borealophlyctis nickersoniae]
MDRKLSEYDIFMLDVVWPSEFGEHFVDLKGLLGSEEYMSHHPDILKADFVGGRLVALPFYGDFGILYYRKDLLQKYGFTRPPETWDDLELQATTVLAGETKTNRGFTGYVAQFEAYEGLTCNLMEWLHGSGGGGLIDTDKRVTLDNPNARAMLQRVWGWTNVKNITTFTALFHREEQALAKWMDGNALFMRNWPYAASVTNTSPLLKSAYGMARLPGVTANLSGGATVGGWHLGVSKYSPNVEKAVQVLQFLTSREVQKQRVIHQGLVPTHYDLYSDPEVCASTNCGLYGSLTVVTRPSSTAATAYLAVSRAVYTSIHAYLTSQLTLDQAVQEATEMAMRAMGTWDPDGALGDPDYIDWNSAAAIALFSVTIVCIGAAIVLFAFMLINRTHRVIRAASPLFCALMIAGNLMSYSTIFTYIGVPTRVTCLLQPWVMVISFAVAMSAIVTKSWRIY